MANSIFLGRLNAEQRKALIERLWKLLYQGVGINELAKEFGRSEYAIHCRLKKLALEHPVESDEIKDNYNKVFGER